MQILFHHGNIQLLLCDCVLVGLAMDIFCSFLFFFCVWMPFLSLSSIFVPRLATTTTAMMVTRVMVVMMLLLMMMMMPMIMNIVIMMMMMMIMITDHDHGRDHDQNVNGCDGAGAGAGAGASLPCWSGLMTNAIFTFFPPKGMHITQTSMLSWRLARSEGGKETCMYASGWQCLIATRSHATNFGSFMMPQHIKEWLFSLTNLWTSRNTFRVCLKLRHWGTDLSLLTLQTMYAQAAHLKEETCRSQTATTYMSSYGITCHHMAS